MGTCINVRYYQTYHQPKLEGKRKDVRVEGIYTKIITEKTEMHCYQNFTVHLLSDKRNAYYTYTRTLYL